MQGETDFMKEWSLQQMCVGAQENIMGEDNFNYSMPSYSNNFKLKMNFNSPSIAKSGFLYPISRPIVFHHWICPINSLRTGYLHFRNRICKHNLCCWSEFYL